jgi:hypothetical protein
MEDSAEGSITNRNGGCTVTQADVSINQFPTRRFQRVLTMAYNAKD